MTGLDRLTVAPILSTEHKPHIPHTFLTAPTTLPPANYHAIRTHLRWRATPTPHPPPLRRFPTFYYGNTGDHRGLAYWRRHSPLSPSAPAPPPFTRRIYTIVYRTLPPPAPYAAYAARAPPLPFPPPRVAVHLLCCLDAHARNPQRIFDTYCTTFETLLRFSIRFIRTRRSSLRLANALRLVGGASTRFLLTCFSARVSTRLG